MAKIDVTAIEGYNSMTPEQKVAALEALTLPDPDYSGYVPKATFDKTSSELAAKKRELAERMSAEEQAQLAAREAQEDLQNKYAALLRESTISKHKARLLGLGYEESLAEDTAKAIADGDVDKVFANQKIHQENFEKTVRSQVLADTPRPVPDGGSNTMTRENFRKLPPKERQRFAQEHPDEYREIYTNKPTGGNGNG